MHRDTGVLMSRRLLVSLSAGLLLLSGCGSQVSGSSATASSTPSASESPELPTAEDCSDPDVYAEWTEYCANVGEDSATPSEEPPTAPANPTFGETYTYENGLAVTVSPPQPYAPSDSAAVGDPAPPNFVAFDITVTNGTQANYDPAMFTATMQSGSTEGQQVFDSANGIGGTPTTTLLPGRESQFRMAFGATDPNDLVLEVAPGFEYESAIFTS
jgi:hypothetical protein